MGGGGGVRGFSTCAMEEEEEKGEDVGAGTSSRFDLSSFLPFPGCLLVMGLVCSEDIGVALPFALFFLVGVEGILSLPFVFRTLLSSSSSTPSASTCDNAAKPVECRKVDWNGVEGVTEEDRCRFRDAFRRSGSPAVGFVFFFSVSCAWIDKRAGVEGVAALREEEGGTPTLMRPPAEVRWYVGRPRSSLSRDQECLDPPRCGGDSRDEEA